MFIKLLNDNEGFVMCILTAIYVLATIVIVYFNGKTIKEMKNTREEETRPYVFANLHKAPRDMCFYLRVENFGKTGAKIESFKITPGLELLDTDTEHEFLKDVIFAPSQRLQFLIFEDSTITSKSQYFVEINYSSIMNSKSYKASYKLTVEYAHQMGYTESNSSGMSDEANQLKNIANYLDCIRNNI